MANPVTGPYPNNVRVVDGDGFCTYYRGQTRYRQARPYNIPTDYYAYTGTANGTVTGPISYGPGADQGPDVNYFSQGDLLDAQAYAQAYDQLKGKSYDSVGLGVDLAEYEQSASMINQRAKQLFSFARHLKKANFVDAAKDIRSAIVPKGVSKRKSFANNFLEWHFGWSPLLGDIHDAAKVMSRPIPTTAKVSGSGWNSMSRHDEYRSAISSYLQDSQAQVSYRVSATVTVENPNLARAEQLGLINPAVVLWEVVPFSFVVDWFANVGDYLQGFSDFAGFTLGSSYVNRKVRSSMTTRTMNWSDPNDVGVMYSSVTAVYFRRIPGIATPPLNFKPLKLPSVTRATTAWALLTQMMKDADRR